MELAAVKYCTMIEYLTRDQHTASTEYREWRAGWRAPPGAQTWYDHECHPRCWVVNPPGGGTSRDPTPRARALPDWSTRAYYWLLHTIQPQSLPCVDVGCGANLFRRVLPTVWGVDPHNPDDRNEVLTDSWWPRNSGRWQRAVSVNALHFGTVAQVGHHLRAFHSILAPGGRAVCAINRQRIWDLEQQERPTALAEQIRSLPGVTRVIWFHSDPREDAWLDGNVWIWFSG